MAAIEEKGGSLYLHVRVQPKASRNAICLEADGRIRVALTAPPIDGAANKGLIAFLAKTLGVPKGSISLVRGEKSREKSLRIQGTGAERVRAILGLPPEGPS